MEEFREGAILLTVLRNRGRVQEEVQGKILGQWGIHASDKFGVRFQITELTTGFYVHGDMSEADALSLAKRLYALGPVPVSVSEGKTAFEDREQRMSLVEIMKQFDKERRGSEVIGDEDE